MILSFPLCLRQNDFLVTIIAIYKNHFDPIFQKLMRNQNKVVADTLFMLAVDAFSEFYTRRILEKSFCIQRCSNLPCSTNSIFYGINYFVRSYDNNNLLRPINHRGNTAAVSINVKQFPIDGNCICSCDKSICVKIFEVKNSFFFRG